MEVLFIIFVIWLTIFMFVSYHAIVNGNKYGIIATAICLWIMAVCLIGITVFG